MADLIIEERSRDIGDFQVGRILPFHKRRMVGPFIFIDHFGPTELGPGKYLDVDQHPHIGLSTLTYLLEGEIEHRDSIGTSQRILPGSVNLMTAGKGVTHTERTPGDLRNRPFTIDGYQIWLALPRDEEDLEPCFHHSPQSDLPAWKEGDATLTLIVGEAFGKKSPVPVSSRLFMVEIQSNKGMNLDLAEDLKGEIGILISAGSVNMGDRIIKEGQMLVPNSRNHYQLRLNGKSTVFLFGGEPFPEKRFIDWNFVSYSKEKLEQAKVDWMSKKFPVVPGDDTYVPYPKL